MVWLVCTSSQEGLVGSPVNKCATNLELAAAESFASFAAALLLLLLLALALALTLVLGSDAGVAEDFSEGGIGELAPLRMPAVGDESSDCGLNMIGVAQ